MPQQAVEKNSTYPHYPQAVVNKLTARRPRRAREERLLIQSNRRSPVKFERPPIIEVACGVAFALQSPLQTAHVGLYWASVLDEFPRTQDAETLATAVENPDPGGFVQNVQVELVQFNPLRRAWLVNKEGDRLLQIQEDRFHYNWKRVGEDAAYPSYENVIAAFRQQWERFSAFLTSQGLGEPKVRQLELTYFNLLPSDGQYLVDHQRGSGERFLPTPEAVNFRSVYFVEALRGRLHVGAQTGRNGQTGEKVLRLEITARGLPEKVDGSHCEQWFDLAHEWITHGFADMTTSEAHKAWGRTS